MFCRRFCLALWLLLLRCSHSPKVRLKTPRGCWVSSTKEIQKHTSVPLVSTGNPYILCIVQDFRYMTFIKKGFNRKGHKPCTMRVNEVEVRSNCGKGFSGLVKFKL